MAALSPDGTPVQGTDLLAAIAAWDQAAWSLGALARVAGGDGAGEITAAALEFLTAGGFSVTRGLTQTRAGAFTGQELASHAAGSLHQADALASGGGIDWSAQSDQVLLAQGRASAVGARAFQKLMLPLMGDLGDRLARPGARMLDIGTGVGALAVAFAEHFPQLQVLGIDVLDRSLALARQAITASEVADRVTVRSQDVAEFSDAAGFDLAFLPAPFVARSAIEAGLPRVAAALRPGGWLFLARGKFDGSAAEVALTRLKTLVYGGTPLTEAEAHGLLRRAGLTQVQAVPTPDGAPGMTIGRR